LERPGIGKGDGGVIGKGSEPPELAVRDAGATEHGQDAQRLTLEDQGLAGKRHDSFRLGPLGSLNCRVRREIIRDERWCPGSPNTAYLPDVQRYATEVSGEPSPVLARVLDGPPGAREQVEAARLVWALGSRAARGETDIARADQPDPCERDPGSPGQPVDDALKNEIDRSRFGDGERNRLEFARSHSVSDTPDRLATQRDLRVDHGFLLASPPLKWKAS